MLDEPIVRFNNEGDIKLGTIQLNKLDGGIVWDIGDVDWDTSRIIYYHNKRRTTYTMPISPTSINKFTEVFKELIYKQDKQEECLQFSFSISNEFAQLIHVNPKFERVENGGRVISYINKFEYDEEY